MVEHNIFSNLSTFSYYVRVFFEELSKICDRSMHPLYLSKKNEIATKKYVLIELKKVFCFMEIQITTHSNQITIELRFGGKMFELVK
jgi:hypothetical protein